MASSKYCWNRKVNVETVTAAAIYLYSVYKHYVCVHRNKAVKKNGVEDVDNQRMTERRRVIVWISKTRRATIPLKCDAAAANISTAPKDEPLQVNVPIAPVHSGDGLQWAIMAHCALGP